MPRKKKEPKKYVFPVFDIDGKTRKIKVKRNFVAMSGCAGTCPIEIRENRVHCRNGEKIHGEVCCTGGARQCCFFCMDESCPVKEVYHDVIAYHGELYEDDENEDVEND